MWCISLVSRLLGLLALLLLAQQAAAQPVTVFSGSPLYRTPETISQAPASFGAFGGDYFIPDFNRAALNGNIWRVPSAGGAAHFLRDQCRLHFLGGTVSTRHGVGNEFGQVPGNWQRFRTRSDLYVCV